MLASAYPPSNVQRSVGDPLIQPKRYAIYPASAETSAVMPKNNAIKPSSFIGGAINKMNRVSEMARIKAMPNARRAGIGVRERESFMVQTYIQHPTLLTNGWA